MSSQLNNGKGIPKVCIIVVSYNTRELTLACLASIYEQARGDDFEVVVVDNDSSDGSAPAIAEAFPQARLLASEINHGFGAANNIAAANTSADWVLLLNPDTIVLDGAIDKLVAFAENHPEATIFGGRTVNGDGILDPTSCWGRTTPWSAFCRAVGLSSLFPGNTIFDSESIGQWRRNSVRQVDIVTGCFFLISKSNWDRLEGFDPRFFMYAEEANLCLRARDQGMACLICPDAEIIHYGGASETVRADKMVRLFRAKTQLFSQHWDPIAFRFGIFTLDLWVLIRMLAYALKSLKSAAAQEDLETWKSVWSRRAQWHEADRRLLSELTAEEKAIKPLNLD